MAESALDHFRTYIQFPFNWPAFLNLLQIERVPQNRTSGTSGARFFTPEAIPGTQGKSKQ